MQKSNEVELVNPTKWWHTLLPHLIWSALILIIIGLLLLFRGPDWVVDAISKFTNKASSSAASASVSIDYLGGGATVSSPFKDAIQACWYYHANYKNSHPYTLLWKKPTKEDVYPKIRVIADPAYWSAQNCEIEKGEVSLIGLEHTKHSIEAQFDKNSDFTHIATSDAYYRSKLSFDHTGRITGRKILQSDFTCKFYGEFDNTGEFWGVFDNEKKRCARTALQAQLRGKEKIQALKEKNSTFNDLEIILTPRFDQNNHVHREAINLYIKEREGLHKELVEQGCGAISIEPKSEKKETGKLIETSIAFLCFKESGSHVRLMQRTSEEVF